MLFRSIEKFLPVMKITAAHKPKQMPLGETLDLAKEFLLFNGGEMGIPEILELTGTDALVVLKEGSIRYETYFNGMEREQPHLLQSVSKSILGGLYGKFISKGVVNPSEKLGNLVSALRGSGFADGTVQQALDMTLSLRFSEEYADPESEIAKLDRACGWRRDRKSTRLNSSHVSESRMPSSA